MTNDKPWKPGKTRLSLRVRAAWHEIRCDECRVSWAGWFNRLVLNRHGYRG